MRKLIPLLVAVLFLTWADVSAQLRIVKGTVLDAANHEPLIGASVLPEGGKTQGVATDIDGKFTIRVPHDVKKVRISYVGYTPVSVELKDNMVVYMNAETSNLDEVVVVAYGTASKESLTGSVAVVGEKEIDKRPVTTVTSALEGMAPGVQVNGSTGTPGSSPTILIRGINSVNGTTAPLYVVDGIVWNGSYNDINPNDVESISVLKDAASCALYGAKGANGVVLITTKRAKGAGRVEVTAKIRQGAYQRAIPQYKRLGYNEWNEAMLQAIANGQYVNNLNGSAPITRDQALKNAIETFFSDAGVLNLYGTGEISGSGEKVFDANGKVMLEKLSCYDDTDWWKAISRNGHRQEYNLSAQGATEKFNFFTSLGYIDEKGYLLNTDFKRWNARMRGEYNPVNYLKIGANLSVSDVKSNQPQFTTSNLSSTSNAMSYQNTAPGLPYYAHDWKTGEILRDENGNPIWNTMSGYSAFVSNKAYILRANSEDYERLSADANAFITAILPYGFELSIKGAMNRYRREDTSYDSTVIGSAQGFGRLSKYFYKQQTHNFSQSLTWTHDYDRHHIDAMLNHENYNRYYDYTYVKNRDELFPDNNYLNNFTNNEGTGASAYRYRTETYMARARYNWNSQYFLEGSFSRDGSSRFSENERWGTFWSVGASWIINKERFLRDAEWLNMLKLRAAYGTAGNDYTSGYYPAWDIYELNSHTLNGNPSIFPTTLGNQSLHWEATKTFDLAIESNFFNNRLSASIGFFSRINADLLYEVSQAPSNGVDDEGNSLTRWMNIGNMRNTGWEIMLSGEILSTKDLSWTAHIDASFIKNKITKLPAGNLYNSPRALIEGKSRYEFYMPKWAGTDMLTGQSLYEINDCHKFQSEKFDDNGKSLGWFFDQEKWDSNLANAEENNALVKIGDKYYTTKTSYASNEFVGTSLPTVYGSFGTNLTWKGLTFGALFTYSLGGKTLDSNYRSMMSTTAGSSLHVDAADNSWVPAMTAGITDANRINKDIRPELNMAYSSDSNGQSSRFLISNDYLTFKNLYINYALPQNWITPLKLRGVNIGLSVDNVCLFAKRAGLNPTYSYSGEQGDYFVPSRIYSFELTVRF